MDSVSLSKTCRRCQIDKPRNAFCKSSRNKDGLQSYCRKCSQLPPIGPIFEPDLPNEKWRDVVGWGGVYAVSNLGRIKRVAKGQRTRVGQILSTNRGEDAYPVAALSYKSRKRDAGVHVLVAESFLGPCPLGMEVNHKNGNKADPRLENLEYVTRSRNQLHAIEMGLTNPARGEKCKASKLTEIQVKDIRSRLGKETQYEIAKRYGVRQSAISRIANRKSWKHV